MKYARLAFLCQILALVQFPGHAAGTDIKYGPWIHNISQTSCNVLWVTTEPTLGFVEVKEDDGTVWYHEEKPRFWQTVSGRRYVGCYHNVRISGLKPGTAYEYKISQQVLENADHTNYWNFGTSASVKKAFKFKTLSHKADSCRFSMLNDIHFNDKLSVELTEDISDIDFLLLNGDICSNARSLDTLIKHTFSPLKNVVSSYPVVFARGNHEGRGEDWHRVPYAFPTPTGEFYYSFRQGPVAFLVLDAGEDKPDTDVEYAGTAAYDEYRAAELEWLKEAVKMPEFKSAPVKICVIHIPTIAGDSCWYTQSWISEHFMPVLCRAGIDLMLSGHHHKFAYYPEHSFGNTYPIYVNAMDERLDVRADRKGIELRAYDRNGLETHRCTIRK